MKVSRQFIKDFAELANRYQWTAKDIEEVKSHMRENFEPMKNYWTILAAAHRAGYKQNMDNGYIRLNEWCHENGWTEFSSLLEKHNTNK